METTKPAETVDTIPLPATETTVTPTQRTFASCRMYENEFPEVDDMVMVRVNTINEIGAWVSLLEYNNKEGFILLSELSRRRMRSVAKHIRVGKQEVLQVLRVDKDKGYIDLSKKNLQEEDIAECTARFNKSKAVHSIMSHVVQQQNEEPFVELEDLYKMVGWPLYKKFEHAYDSFKKAASGEDIFEGIELRPSLKDLLLKTIQHRLGSQPVKIQADIQVTCFSYEGIDAIKPALRAGQACGTEENPIRVQLVCSPEYILVTSAIDHERGIETVKKAVEAIQTEIKKQGGDCVVKTEPRVVE